MKFVLWNSAADITYPRGLTEMLMEINPLIKSVEYDHLQMEFDHGGQVATNRALQVTIITGEA
jgi:hypothetical protein